NRMIERPAVIGQTLVPLAAARPGLWDRGPALRVRVKGGALEAASAERVLAGANVLAIGDGSSDRWEVMQFAHALPVEPGVWEISMRLRGQAGSDAILPEVWPAGSMVVLVDGAPQQITLASSARDVSR